MGTLSWRRPSMIWTGCLVSTGAVIALPFRAWSMPGAAKPRRYPNLNARVRVWGALRRGAGDEARLRLEVGIHHHIDEPLERDLRLPAELRARLRRVGDEQIDFGRAHEL